MATVRYMVNDVQESVAFFTGMLGFEVVQNFGAAAPFASVRQGDLLLWLAGPASSAGRPMPDGRTPAPGGWNRLVLVFENLDPVVAKLREAGATFRNEVISGPGGRQVLIEDPSGNPIEIFQPAS